MGKNILVKEQKEKLEKKLSKLKDERKAIIKSLESEKFQNAKIGEFGDVSDTMSLVTYRRLNLEIVEVQNILKNCIVIEEENSPVVNIGSTFMATINFGSETIQEVFTLVSNREGLNGNYVSIDSPFGSSVYGKGICDNFQYDLSNGEVVTGTVTGINGFDLDNHYQKLHSEYELLLEKKEILMSRMPNKSLLRQIGLLNIKISNYEMMMKNYLLSKENVKNPKTK